MHATRIEPMTGEKPRSALADWATKAIPKTDLNIIISHPGGPAVRPCPNLETCPSVTHHYSLLHHHHHHPPHHPRLSPLTRHITRTGKYPDAASLPLVLTDNDPTARLPRHTRCWWKPQQMRLPTLPLPHSGDVGDKWDGRDHEEGENSGTAPCCIR